MKRASALIAVILCCLMMSVSVFAEEIYIIEDGEDDFIPAETTTAAQAETTTAPSDGGLNADIGSIGDYLGSVAEQLGGSLGSILDGFDDFDFNFGNDTETTTASGLPDVQAGNYPTANKSDTMTTYPDTENGQKEEGTTSIVVEEELPSVLVINGNTQDDSWALSGSTLTLLVFIVAVIILVLVVIIVLVVMTRKTEYNSAVKQKTTLNSVDRPSTLAQFIEDDTPSDNKDYSDIAYWNK